jgi:hypothetical protein
MIESTKAALGLCARPLPAGNGFTWTLTTIFGELLDRAECLYGPRDPGWTILGIEFSGDGPLIWFPGNRRNISIMLSDKARENPGAAIFELSHEVVHLLAPTSDARAPVIEEGLATHFSRHAAPDFGSLYVPSDPAYLDAERLVREVLNLYPDAIRTIRARCPSFAAFTPDLIQSLCPQVPSQAAEKLCSRFSK